MNDISEQRRERATGFINQMYKRGVYVTGYGFSQVVLVGIDPGFSASLSVIKNDSLFLFKTEFPGRRNKRWEDLFLRLEDMRLQVAEILNQFKDHRLIVGIESVAYAKGFQATLMGKIEYILQREVYYRIQSPEDLFMIAPGTAKKFITTNGRATKEEMQDAIQAILGDCPDDHNLSDAIAMALTVRWLWLTKNVGR